MRIITAVIAGIILGFIFQPGAEQSSTVGITILIGIIFYAASQFVAKRLVVGIPKEKQGRTITNGIFAFIFMLLTVMVLVFTALHQH